MDQRDPRFVATIYGRNQRFTAWESVMVQRTFGDPVSTFQFSAAEGYYGDRMLGLQLAPGDPVTIGLAGQKAFTGYVDTRAVAYDDKSHQVIISGVSRTFDLLQGHVKVQPGNFNGSTFEQAARAVMAPVPVSLSVVNPPPGADQPFASLAAQYGERIAEMVTRIASARHLHLTDDVNGNLVAGHAAPDTPVSVTLREGVNIKRCVAKIADPSAYSWATLQAVSQGQANDDNFPARAYSATATNTDVRSHLFGLYIAEEPSDTQGLVTALTHEAIKSLWPVVEVDVTVAGWTRPDTGKLWAPAPEGGSKVSLYSPLVFPNATGAALLGIAAVRFSQDSQSGTETTLTLRLWDLLTHNQTGQVSDAGAGGALPKVAPDTPDWERST